MAVIILVLVIGLFGVPVWAIGGPWKYRNPRKNSDAMYRRGKDD